MYPTPSLLCLDILVGASVMTPTQKIEFIAMSFKSTYPFVATTQTEFDDTKALIALETNPTKITVTNPANAPHILKGRSQEIHVISVTFDAIPYADNLICTASSKNIQYDANGVAIVAPFVDSVVTRGNFNIPANTAITLDFEVNKSGLSNHIVYSLQSKFNRVISASVESR